MPIVRLKMAILRHNQYLYNMALIRFSNLVNDIRGAAGGNVFARNRSGAYVRNRTTPINPQSLPQMAARGLFGILAQQWRTLTQSQRDAWADMAPNYPYLNKLGEERIYSGEQLFIKLNRNLQAAGQTVITDPELPSGVMSALTMTLAADIMGPSFMISGTLTDASGVTELVIQATPPLSAGKSAPDRSAFRNIATSASAAFTAPVDFITQYEAVFGSFAGSEGGKIFVRVYGVNTATGQASAPLVDSTIIVDTTP